MRQNMLLLILIIMLSIISISGCTDSMNVSPTPTPLPSPTPAYEAAQTPTQAPDNSTEPASGNSTEQIHVTPTTQVPVPTQTQNGASNPTQVPTIVPSPTVSPTPTSTPLPTGNIHFRVITAAGDRPDSQWIDTVTVTIAGGPTYSGKSLVGDFFDLPYGQYTVSATVIYIVNSNGDLTTYVYKNNGRDINLSWESMGLHLGCDLVSKNSIPLPTPTPTTTPSPTASPGPNGTISG